jgi:hypothetical protein
VYDDSDDSSDDNALPSPRDVLASMRQISGKSTFSGSPLPRLSDIRNRTLPSLAVATGKVTNIEEGGPGPATLKARMERFQQAIQPRNNDGCKPHVS